MRVKREDLEREKDLEQKKRRKGDKTTDGFGLKRVGEFGESTHSKREIVSELV